MENFVSVILKNREIDENAIVEAMLDALDAPLAERIQHSAIAIAKPPSLISWDETTKLFKIAFLKKLWQNFSSNKSIFGGRPVISPWKYSK